MKKLGRWFIALLVLEMILAFWVGHRIRTKFEAPVRIIGQVTAPNIGAGLAIRSDALHQAAAALRA